MISVYRKAGTGIERKQLWRLWRSRVVVCVATQQYSILVSKINYKWIISRLPRVSKGVSPLARGGLRVL